MTELKLDEICLFCAPTQISALVKLGRLVKPCRIVCVLNLTQLWHMSPASNNAFHKSVIQKSRIGNVALGKPQLWRTKGSSMPMHKALMRITIMVILKQGQLETAGSNHFNTRKHEKTGHWYSDILFPERRTLQNIYGQQCDRKQCLRTSSHPGAPIATAFRNAISTARSMQPVLPEIPRSRTMFQV